jgi:hypothetical protein
MLRALLLGKIVNKKQQLPPKHKLMDMTSHEILIHLPLDHKHVVECHNYFEDSNYYAIVLELCKGGVSALPFHLFFELVFSMLCYFFRLSVS